LLEALDIRRNDMSAEEEEALKAKLDRVWLVGDSYDDRRVRRVRRMTRVTPFVFGCFGLR